MGNGGRFKWILMLIGIMSIVAMVRCEKERSPQEKLQDAISAEGADASVTAGFLVSAMRQCNIVGLSIDDCAKLKGNLIDEQTAQTVAQLAINQRAGYWKACLASFSKAYCTQLLQRAVAIELRKPPTSPSQ